MDFTIEKLESPVRLAELDPVNTLRALGVSAGKNFCDVGAGTGIFTFAARELTDRIFALDMDEAMLAHMRRRAREENIDGIRFIKTTASSLGMAGESCDVALLCTVLHELTDAQPALAEIRKILKADGVLGVIEFHKARTPMGPPVERRIGEEEAVALVEGVGLRHLRTKRLGENFYLQVYGLGD